MARRGSDPILPLLLLAPTLATLGPPEASQPAAAPLVLTGRILDRDGPPLDAAGLAACLAAMLLAGLARRRRPPP